MRFQRTTPRAAAGRPRLPAAATGLIAAAALTTPSATAQQPPPPGPRGLAAVSGAVLGADVAGTAWSADPVTGKLVVTADSTVSPRALARIRAAVGPRAGALKVERAAGVLSRLAGGGGEGIHTPGWGCSAGFNVRRGSAHYVLTAGHCTAGAGVWYTSSALTTAIGPTEVSSFPGDDYGLVRRANPALPRPGAVGDVDITSAAEAALGMAVTRRGAATGAHSGVVTGLGVTVNYGDGVVVSGLIRTDVCGEPGDSGGALHSGSRAIGVTSGGTGDCASGGTTYYQPVTEALAARGLSVY